MTHPRPGSLASRLVPGPAGAVVVVEDEPDIAGFLGAFFRASGTEVVHVDPASAAEVVDTAASTDASCLLVDLNLTGLTGFEVLEAVAADERVSAIPVIIVSADSRAATQERAAALGAVGFVPKPFNVKDLYTTVQSVVDARAGRPAGRPAGTDDAVAATALVSADALQHSLDAAIDQAIGDGTTSTFALVRLAGAAASPVVMAEVARRLEPVLPVSHILGATAADELAVLFTGTGPDDVGSALTAALADGRIDVELSPGRTVTIGIRAGLAGGPADGATGDELYMAADIALAEAVRAGRPVVTAAQTAG